MTTLAFALMTIGAALVAWLEHRRANRLAARLDALDPLKFCGRPVCRAYDVQQAARKTPKTDRPATLAFLQCQAEEPERHFVCTLLRGHPGEHVAHTMLDRELARWSVQ